jgi:hypothetical protein
LTPYDFIIQRLKDNTIEWYYRCQLIYEYHTLRQEEHGKLTTKTGRPKKGQKVWGIRQTAAALGYAIGYTSNAITIAKAIEKDKALMELGSFKLAVRKLGLRK